MTDNFINSILNPKSQKPNPKDVQSVRNLVSSMLLAVKNYSLYPAGHEICSTSTSNFFNLLDIFLKSHEDLHIDVKNDRLLFGNDIILKGKPVETNIAFLLFRDGIQRITFKRKILFDEVEEVLKTINKYTASQDEPEGDIVTALWELNLPHFQYYATDMLWEAEPLYDLSLLRESEHEGFIIESEDEGKEEQKKAEDSNTVKTESVRIANPLLNITETAIDVTQWKLSDEEINLLKDMVEEEQQREENEDLFDVLIMILKRQKDPKDFSSILSFIKDEFKKSLIKCEFLEVLNFFKRISMETPELIKEKPWTKPLIEKLNVALSESSIIDSLNMTWEILEQKEPEKQRALTELLHLLHPRAMISLTPMLSYISSEKVKTMLFDAIVILAQKDVTPLNNLMDRPQTSIVNNILSVLDRVDGEEPINMLSKMLRHPSEHIRREALKSLIKRAPENIRKLFPVVEDPKDDIRRLFLDYISQTRDRKIEDLLLSHIRALKYKGEEKQQILDCYKALGKCGSLFSVAYLQDALFKDKLSMTGMRSVHRQGACIALSKLGLKEAREILNKATHSLTPSIRSAYYAAMGGK